LPALVRGINTRCREHGIPVPGSFAYPGNGIDVEALPVLHDMGIQFARRGGAPEHAYKEGRGFAFEPGRDAPCPHKEFEDRALGVIQTMFEAAPVTGAKRQRTGPRALKA
jgi:hypothetical protein